MSIRTSSWPSIDLRHRGAGGTRAGALPGGHRGRRRDGHVRPRGAAGGHRRPRPAGDRLAPGDARAAAQPPGLRGRVHHRCHGHEGGGAGRGRRGRQHRGPARRRRPAADDAGPRRPEAPRGRACARRPCAGSCPASRIRASQRRLAAPAALAQALRLARARRASAARRIASSPGARRGQRSRWCATMPALLPLRPSAGEQRRWSSRRSRAS